MRIFAYVKHSIAIHSLQELPAAAEQFLSEIGNNRLIAFYAPMGAGKTTFTTAICHALGVRDDAVSSPTFAILNEYRAASGEPVFHFDFYRINRLTEALENIEELLPEETLKVFITVQPDGPRLVTWED